VVLTDYSRGVERAHCLDESSARLLWMKEWRADYRGMDYATGPRAAPTIDGERVYIQGAAGKLLCLRVETGEELWAKYYPSDFGSQIPGWGTAAAPLVYQNLLIAVVAGRPDAKLVAFDKHTGQERWRALSSEESEPGYSQPIVHDERLFLFHAGGLAALDPGSGRLLWEHPYRLTFNTPIATPVLSGPYVLVSSFFQGARLLLARSGELVWRGRSESERNSDTVHALMASPVVEGDYIYGFCNYGQLRCLKLATGDRVWESQQAIVEQARNASGFLVRNRDRTWILNDRGELIIASLTPAGYHEISRTKLLRPTSPPGGRREFKAVLWSHPAFANRHVLVRNDEELARFSLER
jgi:outer membrane protein assembly factor BamB